MSLGTGAVTAIVFVANAVTILYETYPIQLFAFFTGLIAASAIVLFRDLALSTPGQMSAAAAGFGAAVLVASGDLRLGEPTLLLLFLSGMIALSAMLLPGISGSLLLILLGQYVYLSNELSAFTITVFHVLNGDSPLRLLAPGVPLAAFSLGGLVGMATVARVVHVALERYREATLAFLVSLIAGSIRAPIVQIQSHTSGWTSELGVLVTVWVVIGGGVLFLLDHLSGGFTAK